MAKKQVAKQGDIHPAILEDTPSITYGGGMKGGPGKSTVVRALIDRMVVAGRPVVVFDADMSNPDVSRSCLKPGAEKSDVDSYEAPDTKDGILLVEQVALKNGQDWRTLARRLQDVSANYPNAEIVINVGAGDDQVFRENQGGVGAILGGLPGFRVMLVANAERDSANLVGMFLGLFGGRVPIFVIRNLHWGPENTFNFFASDVFLKKVAEINERSDQKVVIGNFPALDSDLQKKLVDGRLLITDFIADADLFDAGFMQDYEPQVDAAFSEIGLL